MGCIFISWLVLSGPVERCQHCESINGVLQMYGQTLQAWKGIVGDLCCSWRKVAVLQGRVRRLITAKVTETPQLE